MSPALAGVCPYAARPEVTAWTRMAMNFEALGLCGSGQRARASRLPRCSCHARAATVHMPRSTFCQVLR